MQIIIPMTGYGSRFVAAGYQELKPFIRVQGRPILEWIVKGMYPGESNFLFICRGEHLKSIKGMEETLCQIAPGAEIYAIEDGVKLGPVYDVLRASSRIKDEEECIINYCDFYMTWDWERFKRKAVERKCDGCIPCYTGYHPHLWPPQNLYASCKKDGEGNLLEIREKYSFEQDKKKTSHSPGVYYFASGLLLKEYCGKLVESRETLKGEYYASMVYNFMVKDGKKVWVPDCVEQFCQWGTPEDLKDYLFYTQAILGWSGQ